LWIRGRQEKLSTLLGLQGATCGNLEHRTRRISSPTCSAIPLGIPVTFGWRFQHRTPCVRPAQSHRENIPACTRISNTIGRGFSMKLGHGNGVTEEAHSWSGVYGFRAGIGAMILHSISWQCKDGASHRKNFDTPPLKGWCKCTTVHLLRFQGHNDFRCTWVHL
jgi:hypothetical protein